MCGGLLLTGGGAVANAEGDSTGYGNGLRFPGANPGAPVVRESATGLTMGNRALQLTWEKLAGGLRLRKVGQGIAGDSLTLTGELFQIILADGRCYRASALKPEGPPHRATLRPRPRAARWAARLPGRCVEWRFRSSDGQLRVRWRALLREEANYLRQELVLTPERDGALKEIRWLDEPVPGAKSAGRVAGAPVVAGPFFWGLEDPNALNEARADEAAGLPRVSCRLPYPAALRRGESLTVSFVWGVAPPGQRRRAFLYYVERERAHPYRPFLHYNSWYDIAWAPFALNETNCLEAIRLWGERFSEPYGVVMDALVFDDGWDDPHTLWQFHAGFPRGFTPLAALARRYHTRLGVWLSPFGGYGQPKQARLQFGRKQGYETNAAGFSLAGTNYYAAFKRACVRMIREYGVNYFKFDGIAAGARASGSASYRRDTEALRRLMHELRREDPNLYLNFTTGSWPSPFWLRYADSLWRQGADMGQAGKGNKQQKWLTYRDQEVYRNIVRRSPLYPLNALMTQGVAYSRHGLAGDPAFDSAGFKDDVRAFFGSGTSLQELYIQPGKLTPADWAVLAEAARWARARADVLVDTHWLGGDPGKGEVYGYASWAPRLGVVMLRNPNDQSRTFALDVGAAFELPSGVPARYALRSPWAEDAAKPVLNAVAGQPLPIPLAPFEVRVLEAHSRP